MVRCEKSLAGKPEDFIFWHSGVARVRQAHTRLDCYEHDRTDWERLLETYCMHDTFRSVPNEEDG
ncbi:hypothetical protein ACFLT5_01210 [Chloroflexota bacterium]